MGALRQAWATITRQLGSLTGKDKALIGSLVVVGALALVLVALWSSRPSLVPLLPDMGPGEQAAAQTTLTEADIEHQVKGGKVYVAPDKRMYALAYLQQAGKLPENTTSLFAALAKGSNWMMGARDSDRLANAALCEVLSGVIGNFKGVERATVMIDAPESIGLGASYRKPTASVGVLMKQGRAIDREMVDAIAAMVSGAKAGLAMADVRVIDQRRGEQYVPRGAGVLGGAGSLSGGGDYLELAQKLEAHMQRKVAEVVMRLDPLSIVTVSVQANNSVKRTKSEEYLKASSVMLPESSSKDETVDKTASGGSGGAAPGVTSNLPMSINDGSGGGGGGGSMSSKTTETEKNKVGLGKREEDKLQPGGEPTRISVMVSLSREYMINLIKTRKGASGAAGGGAEAGGAGAAADAEPSQVDIDKVFITEKQRIEKDLGPLVQTAAVESDPTTIPRVTVSLIPVMQLGMAGMGGGGGVGGSGVASAGGGGGLVSQLTTGPAIRMGFLGALACVALGMMLMLVRKSSKPQTLPSPEELAGLPPVMEAGDDVVGEADEGATAMVGIELGESQIKTKKMLESIEELVQKAPQDAAGLMNRWLNVER